MKKATLIKFLVAVMLVALMLSVGAVAAFATDEATETNLPPSIIGTNEDGSIETKYGTVPADNAGDTFAVFKEVEEGEYEFVDSSNVFNGTTTAERNNTSATALAKNNCSSGSVPVVILYLKDYLSPSSDNSDNLMQLRGSHTIDMNNFTHTLSGNHLMRVKNRYVEEKNVRYKNGKIVIGNAPLLQFRHGNATDVPGTYTVTFENVEIVLPESSTLNLSTRSVLSTVYEDNVTDNEYKFGIDFIDCTFDLTAKSTADSITLISAIDDETVSSDKKCATPYYQNFTLHGCEIKVGRADNLKIVGTINENSSCSFAKADGKYLTVEVAKGAGAPSGTYVDKGANLESADDDIALAFKRVSGTETTDIYELTTKEIAELDFVPKASVTLDSNLIFNMYLPEIDGVSIDEVTLNGEKKTLGEAVDGYYLITEELPAYEAAKTLTLVVNLTVNGSPIKGTFTFSTVKYAEKLIELNGNDDTKAEVTLAKDMLSYIRSAYNYFTEHVSAEDKNTVTAAINEILGSYNVTTLKPVTVPEKSGDREILAGATLVLEATPAFRFVLEAGAKAEGYTFKIGNKVLAYTTGSFVDNDVTYNYYDISLYAYEMLSEITIEKDGKTANYHINTYYDGAVNTDENDIVTKFYNYCTSAKAYRQYVLENQ